MPTTDYFGGVNPWDVPAYGLTEAARYLRLHTTTLRYWVKGRGQYPPVIELPDADQSQLSFRNLVEAHVLAGIRQDHRISLQAVRCAVGFLRNHFDTDHPLSDRDLESDGVDLFVQVYGQTVAATSRQIVMRELLEAHLRRIDRDPRGIALRLYPFTRPRVDTVNELPRIVVIDPFLSFGRPVIAGTGIRTAVILGRFVAGDSAEQLAEEYGRKTREIEEAIRWEKLQEAA